jgi:hypothetical protein
MIEAKMADGTVLRFPAGTPDDVVDRAAAEYMQGTKQPEAPQRGVGEGMLRGLGLGARSAVNVVGALPGLAYDALRIPGQIATAGINAVAGTNIPDGYSSRDILTGVSDAAGLPTAETEAERKAAAVSEALGGVAFGYGAGGLAANSAAPMARTIGRALTAQPLTQAASAATGAYVGEDTDNPWMGMAASLATPVAIAGLRRIVTPVPNVNSPGRQALVDGAERRGIDLTAGQATGSRFLQNVESQFEQLPLTSGPQRAIRENQGRQFIRDAWRHAGESADDTLPTTINASRNRIGGNIKTIANRNTLRFTPQLDSELQQIEDGLRFIPKEIADAVRARIEQLRGMKVPPTAAAAAGGAPPTVPGAAYRLLDSDIGKNIRASRDGPYQTALGELRETIRRAMDASISPADAADWQEARRQYANLMVIANAAGRAGAGAAEGVMSPVALRQALDTSTGGGYVYGRGDMNELARIGQALLKPPPDSGTGGRTYANNLLTGQNLFSGAAVGAGASGGAMVGGPVGAGVGAVGSLALPRMVQMLMNSGAGQSYLRNQVAANPTITQDLARALLIHQVSAALPNMGNP